MREPTDRAGAYRWWRAALKAKGRFTSLNEARDRGVTVPAIPQVTQCGFYARKTDRGGQWVPARIFLHQNVHARTGELIDDEQLICEWAGKTFDAGTDDFATDQWPWFCNRPITQAEYRFGVGHKRWSENQRDEPPVPEQTPTDWSRSPPPTFGKKRRKKSR